MFLLPFFKKSSCDIVKSLIQMYNFLSDVTILPFNLISQLPDDLWVRSPILSGRRVSTLGCTHIGPLNLGPPTGARDPRTSRFQKVSTRLLQDHILLPQPHPSTLSLATQPGSEPVLFLIRKLDLKPPDLSAPPSHDGVRPAQSLPD